MKFRLADKVVCFTKNQSLEMAKAISFEEFSLLKVWGRKGEFPETLMVQVAVDTANLLLAVSSDFQQLGVLQEATAIQFMAKTRPGDVLYTNVVMEAQAADSCQCRFSMRAQDRPVAQGQLQLQKIGLAGCFYPENYRLVWNELCGKALEVPEKRCKIV